MKEACAGIQVPASSPGVCPPDDGMGTIDYIAVEFIRMSPATSSMMRCTSTLEYEYEYEYGVRQARACGREMRGEAAHAM